MIYVLDTNILSAFRRKRPHPAVVQWVSEVGWRELATTVITIAEIQCGIEKARANAPETADKVDGWLERILADGEPQVLGLTVPASRLIGRMYMTPSLRNFVITDPTARNPASGADLSIAAIAITEGAVVATDDINHFLQIHDQFPLHGLFNPIKREWHVERPADGLTPP